MSRRRSPAARRRAKILRAPHPADDDRAADRAGDLHLRLRDPDRGGLSFLGAGTPPEIPTWGNMIASSRAVPGARAVDHLLPRASRWRWSCSRSTSSATGCATGSTRASRGGCERCMSRAAPRASSDLETHFFTERRRRRARSTACRSTIGPGETLGIVGESGCGKSVTALSIMRLLPPRLGRTVGGSVRSRAATCWRSTRPRCASIRGNRIAMIFQEPMTTLNPVLTIGHQIAEAVRIHKGARAGARRASARRRDAEARAHPGRASAASTTIRTSSPAACASA